MVLYCLYPDGVNDCEYNLLYRQQIPKNYEKVLIHLVELLRKI